MGDAIGTYECPICGFDKPHTHEAGIVEWHRTGKAPSGFLGPGPMNDAQRRSQRMRAEAEWRENELRARFDADPIGTIQGGPPDNNWSGRDWVFYLTPHIVRKLNELIVSGLRAQAADAIQKTYADALEARVARLQRVAVAADGAASHVSNGAWYAALRTALAALQDGDLKEGA